MKNSGELEKLQKKARIRYGIMWIVAGILFVVFLAVVGIYEFRTSSDSMTVRIGVTVCAAGAIALGFIGLFYTAFVKKSYQNFNLYFKTNYVLPILRQSGYFQDLSYSPQGGFSYGEIRDSAVVASGDARYYHSEDLLSGSYRGIRFLYGDVETKRMVVTRKRREIRTIFEGQIMRFSLLDETKRSFGYVQIFEKDFLFSIRGWTAQNKIQTENKAFNQRFQVYADDPENAFSILTPPMLEQILQFADEVGEQIAITFAGSTMYVAIHRTRSMFDGYVDQPIRKQREEIDQDIQLLCRAGDLLILS